jgi:hypothetical protein
LLTLGHRRLNSPIVQYFLFSLYFHVPYNVYFFYSLITIADICEKSVKAVFKLKGIHNYNLVKLQHTQTCSNIFDTFISRRNMIERMFSSPIGRNNFLNQFARNRDLALRGVYLLRAQDPSEQHSKLKIELVFVSCFKLVAPYSLL